MDGLRARDHQVRRLQYARRHRIRLIDGLLNELELLNVAGESEVPGQLSERACAVITSADTHSLVMPPDHAIPIADWMTALFEVQDTLMVSLEDRPAD
ncbi:MAG: hypothetical protein ABR977_00415 [Candidatus Dormibacteria bacterium]